MSRARSVLIVEDEPATRDRLRQIITGMSELHLLAAVGSCGQAREELNKELPDVMLTDLGLPDGSGLELIQELRKRSKDAEIVVISMFGDERNVVRSIEQGASGYLPKGGHQEEIERAMRELLAGGSPISPAIARHLLKRFQPQQEAPVEDASVLSERETEVLRLVAKGFTFVEIGGLLEISTHTVTTHMRRVYRKLEVRSRAEAVYEAAHLGIISIDS